MKLRMLLCALIVALFTFQTIPVAAVDEGMWTFNNVPREDIKQSTASTLPMSGYGKSNLLQCASRVAQVRLFRPTVWCSQIITLSKTSWVN